LGFCQTECFHYKNEKYCFSVDEFRRYIFKIWVVAAAFPEGDQTMDNLNEPKFQTGNETAAGSQADLSSNNSVNIKTPLRLVMLVVVSVFLGEVLVLLLLSLLPAIPVWGEALIDAAMLVIFISPVLYCGLFRSLIRQLEQRRKLSKELEKHTLRLEELVAERTSDNNLREALGESCRRRDEVSALLEGARAILKNREFEPTARNIFYHCKNLIGATAGYVALLNSTGTENEVLFLDSGERSCTVDPSTPMPIRGLRAEAYSKAAAVYENHFSASEWHSLLPGGHVNLQNVLFAPMNVNGRPAGVIGLANKPGGFDENDLRMAAAFGELAAVALLNCRTLESLQDSEERFRSVVATANEGIILVDSGGEIQFWNNGAERMFGYSAEEVNGRNIDFIIPKRFQNAHQNALKNVVATGQSKFSDLSLNLTGTRKDGTEFPLELTLATWKTKNQHFFTAVIRDVTERKQAEEALNRLNLELEARVKKRTAELHKEIDERKAAEKRIRESRAMLQAVFDGIFDPLILVDKNMRIKMLNKKAAEYYGISDYKKAVGKICHEAAQKSDLCTDCQIPAAASKGQYVSFERKSFSNPEAVEQIVVYPVEDRGGDIGDAIIRITDITEAKKIERRLIQSEKMASLGILVSSIAHEINNPNNFVSFNIPILRDYAMEIVPYLDKFAEKNTDLEICNMPYPEFRRDIFKLIDNLENGSRRISTFVANLREYSQGGSMRAFSWLDLAVLIDKVLAIIQAELKMKVKIFNKSICTNLPEIYSDPHSIEQILINLLLNASQAVNGENSRVDLVVTPGDDNGGVVVEITDNGCGMDERTQNKIFDPFFTTKPAARGTGLGLYVCHNLIQALGGRIDVQSEPGKGATFRLLLPGKAA
jgi:PAS domain S-box-containing protein